MIMNKKLRDKNTELLAKAVLLLKTEEEFYNFFEDLCTISEIQSMGQRIEVARMLDKGMVYADIAKQTGASTATISRVNRCLNYGSDGYRAVLDRLAEDE